MAKEVMRSNQTASLMVRYTYYLRDAFIWEPFKESEEVTRGFPSGNVFWKHITSVTWDTSCKVGVHTLYVFQAPGMEGRLGKYFSIFFWGDVRGNVSSVWVTPFSKKGVVLLGTSFWGDAQKQAFWVWDLSYINFLCWSSDFSIYYSLFYVVLIRF